MAQRSNATGLILQEMGPSTSQGGIHRKAITSDGCTYQEQPPSYLPVGLGLSGLVAIPYCYKCSRKVDPFRERCPKCGSVVRFRFVDKEKEASAKDKEEKPGFIRPPWKAAEKG